MHSKRATILVSLVILVIGLAGGAWEFSRKLADQRERLEHGVLHYALAFSDEEVARLAGSPADIGSEPHSEITGRLREIIEGHPAICFASLMRFDRRTDSVVSLAAAGPDDDEARIPRAGASLDGTPDARAARELAGGVITATRLFHNDWPGGRWVSAYARIGDPFATDSAGPVLHVLRYDIDAGYWTNRIFENVAWVTLAIWLLLGLPLIGYRLGRFRDRQSIRLREFGEAIEQTETAIFIGGFDGRIAYVNPAFCAQTGYSKDELLGSRWSALYRGQLTPEEVAHRKAVLRSGAPVEVECEFLKKDGTPYFTHITMTPVRDDAGEVNAIILLVTDITEQKNRDEALLLAKDQAEQTDRAKNVFLRAMSEEMSGPLNNLVELSRSLRAMPLNEEQAGFVETIRKSADTLVRLTGDILDFSHITSGLIKMAPVRAEPRALIEETLDLLAAQAARKKITLLRHVMPGVPRAIIIDAMRLRQVLLNLAGNALKFTARGEVEISLRVLAPDDKNGATGNDAAENTGRITLFFSVRDTGIGIAREDQEKLFTPFWQADSTGARCHGGAGLGLAISRNLIEMLGGNICVKSEPGRGSVFSFTASCALPDDAGPPGGPPELKGLRVLVVSDNASLASELHREISGCGASVAMISKSAPGETDPGAWDAAVVDCDGSGDAVAWRAFLEKMSPRTNPVFGLIDVGADAATRQRLGGVFRVLLTKPVHYGELFHKLALAARTVAEGRGA